MATKRKPAAVRPVVVDPEGLCVACERGSHDNCSAQVLAAKAPCGCEHCWGKGGSVAFYAKVLAFGPIGKR